MPALHGKLSFLDQRAGVRAGNAKRGAPARCKAQSLPEPPGSAYTPRAADTNQPPHPQPAVLARTHPHVWSLWPGRTEAYRRSMLRFFLRRVACHLHKRRTARTHTYSHTRTHQTIRTADGPDAARCYAKLRHSLAPTVSPSLPSKGSFTARVIRMCRVPGTGKWCWRRAASTSGSTALST